MSPILRWTSDREENIAAEALLRQAVDFDPSFAKAHARLAEVYTWRLQVLGAEEAWADSAVAAANRAIEARPGEREGWAARGAAHFNQGRLEDAAYDYRRASELSPTWGEPRDWIGFIYYMRGRFDEAIGEFAKAMELMPASLGPVNSMAQTLLSLGDLPEVERWLAPVFAGVPNQPGAVNILVSLLAAQGRWNEARERSEALLGGHPDNAFAYEIAMRAALGQRDFDRAITLGEQARRLEPRFRNLPGLTIRSGLGHALLRTGRVDEGRIMLEEVIGEGLALVERGDQRPGVFFDVACAYAALGDADSAIRYLERAYAEGLRHFTFLPWFDTLLEPLEHDTRYEAWLARMSEDIIRMAARIRLEDVESQLLANFERNRR